jgi:hydrogenase nickel incorporation protein HypA/HybF
MHETAIALEILRASQEAVAQHGGGKLVRVKVAVGELAAVEPELLRYAWEAATAGTSAAGAQLEVAFCPAVQRCPSCGPVPREPGAWVPLCLSCGAPLLVEGGTELDLLQVEFEPDGGGHEPSR